MLVYWDFLWNIWLNDGLNEDNDIAPTQNVLLFYLSFATMNFNMLKFWCNFTNLLDGVIKNYLHVYFNAVNDIFSSKNILKLQFLLACAVLAKECPIITPILFSSCVYLLVNHSLEFFNNTLRNNAASVVCSFGHYFAQIL